MLFYFTYSFAANCKVELNVFVYMTDQLRITKVSKLCIYRVIRIHLDRILVHTNIRESWSLFQDAERVRTDPHNLAKVLFNFHT